LVSYQFFVDKKIVVNLSFSSQIYTQYTFLDLQFVQE